MSDLKINNIDEVENKVSCKGFTASYLMKRGYLPISKEGEIYLSKYMCVLAKEFV